MILTKVTSLTSNEFLNISDFSNSWIYENLPDDSSSAGLSIFGSYLMQSYVGSSIDKPKILSADPNYFGGFEHN